MRSELYYEAHITVDPLSGSALGLFKELCRRQGFKVADLLMVKPGVGTIPSDIDSFCTTRSKFLEDISARVRNLVTDCRISGIKVRRYKIEDTVLDSKIDDVFELFEDSVQLSLAL